MDAVFPLDVFLKNTVLEYSLIAYALLFLIIFLETGLMMAPFLPGDSLLFTAGALAAAGSFRVDLLFLFIFTAAIIGDAVNYHVGKFVGGVLFKKGPSLFFHKEHLTRTRIFYDKLGVKMILMARFIPLLRIFAPSVAAMAKMPYRFFLVYNVLGVILWSGVFIWGGFFLGKIPWVQNHFWVLILAVVAIALIPLGKEIVVHFSFAKKLKQKS